MIAPVLAARLDALIEAAGRSPDVALTDGGPPATETSIRVAFTPAPGSPDFPFPATMGELHTYRALLSAVPDVLTVGSALTEIRAAREALLSTANHEIRAAAHLLQGLAGDAHAARVAVRLADRWPWSDGTRAGALASLVAVALDMPEEPRFGDFEQPGQDAPNLLGSVLDSPMGPMLVTLNLTGMALEWSPVWRRAVSPGPSPAVGGAARPMMQMGTNGRTSTCTNPIRYPPFTLGLLWRAFLADMLETSADVAWGVARDLAVNLAGDDGGRLRTVAVRDALSALAEEDPLAARVLTDDARIRGWAAELAEVAGDLAAGVPVRPGPGPELSAEWSLPEAIAAARAADAHLSSVLAKLGPEAGALAAEVTETSAPRLAALRPDDGGHAWALWTEPPARWWRPVVAAPWSIRLAARALWPGKWRGELEKEEQTRRRVGLAVLVPRAFDPVVATTRAQRAGPVVGGVLTLEDDRGSSLSELVINSHTAALPEYSPREIRALASSMTSHRWIRFALPELQGLWFIAGREVPIIIEGGKAGIVERLRAAGLGGSRRDEPLLPGVIALWGAVRAMTDRTVGNLYSYEMPRTEADWKTRTGRFGAVVKVSPGPVLDPHVMMRERRKLTIPLIRDLPPLHWVDTKSHSPVMTLTMLIVRDMWVQREEMLDEGGILGGAAWWSERTQEGGLRDPGPLAWERVRDGLRSEDGRTEPGRAGGVPVPPFIRVVNPAEPEARWRYTLANDAARVWIENAGRASKGGAERFAKGEDKRKKGRLKP